MMAPTQASTTNAARTAYSTAVIPDSSPRNRRSHFESRIIHSFRITVTPCTCLLFPTKNRDGSHDCELKFTVTVTRIGVPDGTVDGSFVAAHVVPVSVSMVMLTALPEPAAVFESP